MDKSWRQELSKTDADIEQASRMLHALRLQRKQIIAQEVAKRGPGSESAVAYELGISRVMVKALIHNPRVWNQAERLT